MNTKSKSIPVSDAQALLNTLKETFPVFLNNEPLAIGIDKQILARLPETPRKVLRMVLAYHTKSTRYLQKTIKATTRFDLDGNPAEPLEETHKTHAEEMLKERAKNNAERAKAEAKLKREQQAAAEEAEKLQKRAEKINQLAQKFAK